MVGIDPFAPAQLGPINLRNRIIKAATFEGRTPRRVVTPELIDFHRRFAAGGVGMTTVAYCAVSRDGRSAPGEIVLTPEPGLRRLTDAVHAEGAAACAQIGHAATRPTDATLAISALGSSRRAGPRRYHNSAPRSGAAGGTHADGRRPAAHKTHLGA